MSLPKYALLALCTVLLGAIAAGSGAHAQTVQDERWDRLDFKPLVPPVFPVPPNSQINPGSVGGARDPYTTAPLQNPPQSPNETAPGLRFSIPSRQGQ